MSSSFKATVDRVIRALQSEGFGILSDIDFAATSKKKLDHRLFAGSVRIRDDHVYSAAFVTAQAVPTKFGHDRAELEVDAITALRRLFAARGAVTPSSMQTVYEV